MAVTLPSSTFKKSRSPVVAILWTGFLVGSLDAAAAISQYLLSGGERVVMIFRYIASGAFGPGAFAENPAFAYWGLFFHYFFAYSFTILYFLLAARIKWLQQHKIAAGIAYGIFIWLVMNKVVVPLTAIPKSPFHLDKALIAAGILIVAIGLPLSFIASAFYARK